MLEKSHTAGDEWETGPCVTAHGEATGYICFLLLRDGKQCIFPSLGLSCSSSSDIELVSFVMKSKTKGKIQQALLSTCLLESEISLKMPLSGGVS